MQDLIGFEEFKEQGINIKKRRTAALIVAIVAVILVMLLGSPSYVEIMGEVIAQSDGVGFWGVLQAVLAIIIVYIVAFYLIISPVINAMITECDPKKYIGLTYYSEGKKAQNISYSAGYFYMGEFEKSLEFAERELVASKKPYTELFYKASCLFFLGRMEEFRSAVLELEARLLNESKKKAKARRSLGYLYLLLAISENDKEKIIKYRAAAEPIEKTAPNTAYLSYIKGVAAFCLKERNEAIYRFMSAKEMGSKAFFPAYVDVYLEKLN